MQINMSFGAVRSGASPLKAAAQKFRIVVLGDFTSRANQGQLETGEALAKRKPVRVDVDNLDDVIKRWKPTLQLPIAKDGGTIEVSIGSMDDFHPDQLYDNVELFSELAGLRQRLKNRSTFAAAAKEMQSWLDESSDDEAAAISVARRARGTVMPVGRMDDFAELVGRPTGREGHEAALDGLLKQIVSSHVVPAKDPQQDKMVAAVDAALSASMRAILHHPDFQALESLWRCVDLLVRRLESDNSLHIVLLDVTAEEIAADLSQATSLEESGLYKLLVEQPSLDTQQGPYALVIGNFVFEQIPPHAELLGRLAKLGVLAKAPFVAAVSNEVLKKVKPEEINPLVTAGWDSLRSLPESAYLGLTVPRFLLRWPYGKNTEPVDPFAFEEFNIATGVRGMLWGNGAFLFGLALALTFAKQGMKGMQLGTIATIGDMPYHYYKDADGDQIALPCTDRLLSETLCQHVTRQGLIPLVSFKNRPEVRLGSFQSLAGKPILGPWSTETVTLSSGGAPSATPAPVAASTPVPAPAPAAPAAPAADDELDALLASLGGGDSSTPAADAAAAPAAADASADAELDALLASLGGDSSPPAPAGGDAAGGDAGMDPDLAALLADL